MRPTLCCGSFTLATQRPNNYIHMTPQVPKETETGKESLVGNYSRSFCARNGSCMSLFGFGEKYHLEVSTHSRMLTWSFSTVTVQGISSGTLSPTIANKQGMFPTGRFWIIVSFSTYLWEFLLNHNLTKAVSIRIWASFMLHKVPESSRWVGDANTVITLLCSL